MKSKAKKSTRSAKQSKPVASESSLVRAIQDHNQISFITAVLSIGISIVLLIGILVRNNQIDQMNNDVRRIMDSVEQLNGKK